MVVVIRHFFQAIFWGFNLFKVRRRAIGETYFKILLSFSSPHVEITFISLGKGNSLNGRGTGFVKSLQ